MHTYMYKHIGANVHTHVHTHIGLCVHIHTRIDKLGILWSHAHI